MDYLRKDVTYSLEYEVIDESFQNCSLNHVNFLNE